MKKGTSISLALLMIAAMFHFSVATHFCGGKLASSKVSLTGKLANCGMEDTDMQVLLSGINFSKHCCDDVVTYYGIDSNYIPSFSYFPESFQHNFQIFSIPAENPPYSVAVLSSHYINLCPPGALMSTCVDLSGICVFRI